jgi:type 1 glutamine amidotransferase
MAAIRMAAILGDSYHKPDAQRAAIEAAAADLATGFDVFVDPLAVPWESLSRWAMIIMAREGRSSPAQSKDVWFTASHEHALSAFVREGGALAVLHAGLASYGHDGEYGGTTHGSFINHPAEHPEFAVRPTGAAHEITRDVNEFSIRDEMYFVRVDSVRTTILMESVSPDYGSSAAAWAHHLGRGRVFCFTPGHRDEVLSHPGYRGILKRGLRWAAGV